MRTQVTKETIYQGMYLKTIGGCTTRMPKFFYVAAIHGAKVFLCEATVKVHTDQYGQEGTIELIEGSARYAASAYAKFTTQGLKLANESFQVGSYYPPLSAAQVGDMETFHGD